MEDWVYLQRHGGGDGIVIQNRAFLTISSPHSEHQAPTRDGVKVGSGTRTGPTALAGSGAKATNNDRHMASALPATSQGHGYIHLVILTSQHM